MNYIKYMENKIASYIKRHNVFGAARLVKHLYGVKKEIALEASFLYHDGALPLTEAIDLLVRADYGKAFA